MTKYIEIHCTILDCKEKIRVTEFGLEFYDGNRWHIVGLDANGTVDLINELKLYLMELTE